MMYDRSLHTSRAISLCVPGGIKTGCDVNITVENAKKCCEYITLALADTYGMAFVATHSADGGKFTGENTRSIVIQQYRSL